jgi:hypothetical protein
MKDPTFHAHSKHIDVQYHYTHERVNNKDVFFQYTSVEPLPLEGLILMHVT